jgi:hypothetical protein
MRQLRRDRFAQYKLDHHGILHRETLLDSKKKMLTTRKSQPQARNRYQHGADG